MPTPTAVNTLFSSIFVLYFSKTNEYRKWITNTKRHDAYFVYLILQQDSPSKEGKKKKDKKDKKGRMPSFSFGKKKDAKKSKVQTAV